MGNFVGLSATQAMLQFSLTIINDIKPYCFFFQTERPLPVFVWKSKRRYYIITKEGSPISDNQKTLLES